MSDRSKSTAFLLCYFLGLFGVHRFYVGKVKTGLLMLVTLGGLGIWWLVDSVLIAAGQFRDRDDRPLRTGPPDPENPAAGFWVRAAAMSVDTVILMLVISAVLAFTGVVFVFLVPYLDMDLSALEVGDADGAMTQEQMALSMMLMAGIMLVVIVLALAYFTIQHASRHQATVGKRCFDLQVTTTDGARVGYGRALWRSIAFNISGIPMYLGYVLAAFTRDKRALHDFLAGTRVRYAPDTATAMSPGDTAISPESTTVPNLTAAPIRAAMAGSATVDKRSGSGTVLIALGALLLAGAVAAGLLL